MRYGTMDFLVIVRDSYTETTFIALTRSCTAKTSRVVVHCGFCFDVVCSTSNMKGEGNAKFVPVRFDKSK
jgi:hypothetical protein